MDDTRRAFDRHAFRYQDRWGADPVAQIMRHAVHAALDRHAPPGCRILDAGCGIGLDTAWLADHGRAVVALDASAQMAAHAARAAPSAEVHHLSALDAPALQTTFDAALLNFGVLNCLPLPAAAQALAAVVRPGGRLLLVPMPRLSPAWMLHRLRHGHPGEALRRLRRTLLIDVEGVAVPTRYLSGPEIRAALRPWFVLREQQSLGLLLPPPGSAPSAARLRRAARLEDRLCRLPLLRELGDHLLMVLERRDRDA